jgi:hypothetical protein
VAVLGDALAAFDLANPFAPAAVHSCRLPGVRGAANWPDGLLTFGAGGFASIDRELRTARVGPDGPCDDVLDAVPGAGAWYVLAHDAIEVRTQRLCPVAAVPCEGARCLLRLGHRIVAGGATGIAVYDVSRGGEPQLESGHGGIAVAALCLPPQPSAAAVVAVLEDGSARALAIARGAVTPTAFYPRPPWFFDSLRIRDLLVRVSPDRSALDVGVLGAAQLVGAEAMAAA